MTIRTNLACALPIAAINFSAFLIEAKAQSFFAPNDPNARYELLSARRVGAGVTEIVTSRAGLTATAYLKMHINCQTDMTRVLAAGVALNEMQTATGNSGQWRKNVSGTAFSAAAQLACTKMGMR
jgi:hypothetical protein